MCNMHTVEYVLFINFNVYISSVRVLILIAYKKFYEYLQSISALPTAHAHTEIFGWLVDGLAI